MKGGFYHDGQFATLRAVVDHYDTLLALGLTDQQKRELIEYLKSL
jgi:cytochrome c peroxidase